MICGSVIPNMQLDETILVMFAGSLDLDIGIKANLYILYEGKTSWDQNLEKAKKFKDYPKKIVMKYLPTIV